MRFSLLTLLLAALFAGSVLGVVQLNGAWHQVETVGNPPLSRRALMMRLLESVTDRSVYPDPRFVARADEANQKTLLTRPLSEDPLGRALFKFPGTPTLFLDAETAVVFRSSTELSLWHKRYPEYWWGHFYRPELWGAVVFGALTLLNLLREYRARRVRA